MPALDDDSPAAERAVGTELVAGSVQDVGQTLATEEGGMIELVAPVPSDFPHASVALIAAARTHGAAPARQSSSCPHGHGRGTVPSLRPGGQPHGGFRRRRQIARERRRGSHRREGAPAATAEVPRETTTRSTKVDERLGLHTAAIPALAAAALLTQKSMRFGRSSTRLAIGLLERLKRRISALGGSSPKPVEPEPSHIAAQISAYDRKVTGILFGRKG